MGAVTPETCRVVLQWINICILLHLLDFYSHILHTLKLLVLRCIVFMVIETWKWPLMRPSAKSWNTHNVVIYTPCTFYCLLFRHTNTTLLWDRIVFECSKMFWFTQKERERENCVFTPDFRCVISNCKWFEYLNNYWVLNKPCSVRRMIKETVSNRFMTSPAGKPIADVLYKLLSICRRALPGSHLGDRNVFDSPGRWIWNTVN